MPKPPSQLRTLEAMIQIIADLRGPEGCPWDKEQDHISLAPYAVEEMHELAEALELQNDALICEELGDVLFQVILHSQLARERNAFELADVIEGICKKVVYRHPHVFAENSGNISSEEVLKNWEILKKAEKEKAGPSNDKKSLLNVPPGLPALQRAAKIGFRTQKMGFDWENPEQVLAKVTEEYHELLEAYQEQDPKHIQHEIGDLLFSIAQFARHLDLDPEQVGREANRRFENRFEKMHQLATQKGLVWEQLTPEQKESLWQEVKTSFDTFLNISFLTVF